MKKIYKKTASSLLIYFLFTASIFSQITVSSSATWTSVPTGAENGIIITTGGGGSFNTLTLSGITINFVPGAEVTLAIDCKLIINNSTLQVNTPNTLWDGIIANGNGSIEQFSTIPDHTTLNDNAAWEGTLNNEQTLVDVTGSNINDATCGITSNNGAIVRVRANSTFLGCWYGVQLNAYSAPTNS